MQAGDHAGAHWREQNVAEMHGQRRRLDANQREFGIDDEDRQRRGQDCENKTLERRTQMEPAPEKEGVEDGPAHADGEVDEKSAPTIRSGELCGCIATSSETRSTDGRPADLLTIENSSIAAAPLRPATVARRRSTVRIIANYGRVC